jgi:subtilisin family serine protease
MSFIIHLLIFGFYLISHAATIAIIDTGFDLDHDFLRPKILKKETDEEAISPGLKDFRYWQFQDNSHLKTSVIQDPSLVNEILLFRSIRAKGHKQGLTLDEFEWFKKKNSDKIFMESVRKFKRHAHGTFVAGIALREGENINIFPIRGLNLPHPIVAVEDSSIEKTQEILALSPEDKFKKQIQNSINRVAKKFSKICRYVAENKIDIVNASYGITYKNIVSKFREKYKETVGKEIEEHLLQTIVNDYFTEIFKQASKTIAKYPNILFIFSAGNSGLSNDEYPHYPSKIKLPNTLSIGATNGEFLATFSNFGLKSVDIGAPGVAILSLVPKVYSQDGKDLYSPSSGTSMAAPYVSNLAAQIKNINPTLKSSDIKEIIINTGDEKDHLKDKFISGSIVNNERALKAALLSKDLPLQQSINLSRSNLIPMEDSISIGQPPAVAIEKMQEKVMDFLPKSESTDDLEEPNFTNEVSSQQMDQAKVQPDKKDLPASAAQDSQMKSADPIPSNQTQAPVQKPFEDLSTSSFEALPQPEKNQSPEFLPSSP